MAMLGATGPLLAAPLFATMATRSFAKSIATGTAAAGNPYAKLGVRTIINARGTYTYLSGCLELPEVRRAAEAASHHFVDLYELQAAAGRRLSEISGAESGIVTAGAAAAMAQATAGCIAGTDPEKIWQLPDTTGLKNEVVMLGGHLDSWIAGTGATDNGAGTIVAMEAVRILKALGVKPRRTIRIVLWSGEEQGLFGSKGYCKQHYGSAQLSTAPDQMMLPEFMRRATGPLEVKPEQKQISGYFNVDNGSGKIRGIYLQGSAAIAPIFAQWMAPLKDLGVTTLTMRNTGGTDHLSFDAVGIPGFQFIQDDLDYESRTHHSNQDVYERLQPADLKQIATVEAIFVYDAAMRDQMLPRKPLPNPETEEKLRAPLEGIMPNAVPPPAPEKK